MKYILILFVSFMFVNADTFAQAPKDSTKSWFSLADSSAYTGNYKVEGQEFDAVKIIVKENSLYFYAGTYEGPLEPLTAKDNFLVLGQVTMVFSRDEKNEITGFKADTGSTIVVGKKEKPAEAPKQK